MLSFAICSLASSRVRFSELALADMLVMGVDPPVEEGAGVEAVEPVEPFAACFAAFSARRFCLDADGGMVGV